MEPEEGQTCSTVAAEPIARPAGVRSGQSPPRRCCRQGNQHLGLGRRQGSSTRGSGLLRIAMLPSCLFAGRHAVYHGGQRGKQRLRIAPWETATCGQVCRAYLEGHAGTVAAVAFAPDGLWVASASEDGTALVWDLREAAPDFFPEPPRSINADLLDCLWEALSGDNAATAYRAVCSLADHPQEALDFLKARLKKAPPRDSEGVRRLITDLGNDDFEMRETASRKLKDFARICGTGIAPGGVLVAGGTAAPSSCWAPSTTTRCRPADSGRSGPCKRSSASEPPRRGGCWRKWRRASRWHH